MILAASRKKAVCFSLRVDAEAIYSIESVVSWEVDNKSTLFWNPFLNVIPYSQTFDNMVN